ncbi:hypothetical protein D7D52_06715 [Nocardia yunnanensis]|uniref:Uncharacterized protein n=2 Tax=Nocardia yunnanensis TaxID=2382165 RepID=A0A386Z919_9NOCA|nr:hypothetical protein D7D52_06715 [Nocardia yunnanensis]
MLTKALAATALSTALIGMAATPATATPVTPAAPAQSIADSIADSGSASGSAQLLKVPLSLLYVLLCGMWASPSPNPNPLCNTPNSGSAN